MHPYSTDAPERESIPKLLAVLAVLAALALDWMLRSTHTLIPWWVDTPAVMGFYGLFFIIWDKWLWALRLGPLRLSKLPDLGGEWRGELRSSFSSTEPAKAACVTIRQTWSRILVTLESVSSHSASTMATVYTVESADHGIKYEYLNHPKALMGQAMQPHRGLASLRLKEDGKVVEGDYFTARKPPTDGALSFRRSTAVSPTPAIS